MAYGQRRSANTELKMGMTDGSYRKGNPDRGGQVEMATWYARDELGCDRYFNLDNIPAMMDLPDGRKFVDPQRVELTEEGKEHNNPSMMGVLMYGGGTL